MSEKLLTRSKKPTPVDQRTEKMAALNGPTLTMVEYGLPKQLEFRGAERITATTVEADLLMPVQVHRVTKYDIPPREWSATETALTIVSKTPSITGIQVGRALDQGTFPRQVFEPKNHFSEIIVGGRENWVFEPTMVHVTAAEHTEGVVVTELKPSVVSTVDSNNPRIHQIYFVRGKELTGATVDSGANQTNVSYQSVSSAFAPIDDAVKKI